MTQDDLPVIKAVDGMITGAERSPTWLEHVEALWFIQRPAIGFIAEADGRVVGFILGDIREAEHGLPTCGWIDMVGVIPEYQRRGIARRLAEEFSKVCRNNLCRIRLIVREDDTQLIDFWESMGFRRGKLMDLEN